MRTQPRRWLILADVDRFRHGLQILAHSRTEELQVARNGAYTLLANQMVKADLGNDFHA